MLASAAHGLIQCPRQDYHGAGRRELCQEPFQVFARQRLGELCCAFLSLAPGYAAGNIVGHGLAHGSMCGNRVRRRTIRQRLRYSKCNGAYTHGSCNRPRWASQSAGPAGRPRFGPAAARQEKLSAQRANGEGRGVHAAVGWLAEFALRRIRPGERHFFHRDHPQCPAETGNSPPADRRTARQGALPFPARGMDHRIEFAISLPAA